MNLISNNQLAYYVSQIPIFFLWWWSYNTVMHDVFQWPALTQWFQALAAQVLVTGIGSHVRYNYHWKVKDN